jgi:hypothetical protein
MIQGVNDSSDRKSGGIEALRSKQRGGSIISYNITQYQYNLIKKGVAHGKKT